MTYSIESMLVSARRSLHLCLLPLCFFSAAATAQPMQQRPPSITGQLQEQKQFWAFGPADEAKPDLAAPEAVTVTELFEAPQKLSPGDFLQTLIRRNLEIQYSRTNLAVTANLMEAESGLYEPSVFANARGDGRRRQRTIEETRQLSSSTGVLEENNNTREFGLRGKLPSGAEFSISQKAAQRTSNLLAQSSLGAFDTEYTGSLALSIKQPLMKNAGRNVTETDRRVAELEHKAAGFQLIQQTLKSAIDGLNLYWQLYKAQETATLRKDALTAAQSLLNDTQWRISAGRAPSAASLELRSLVLNREMEMARAQQALSEAQAKVLTALHAVRSGDAALAVAPRILPIEAKLDQTPPALSTALENWPPYQLALVRQEQSQVRLAFAKNQRLPNLDLVVGYNGSGLAYRGIEEIGPTVQQFSYPDWYIGVNFEMPLGGGRKTRQQLAAQEDRSRQSYIDLEAIRNALANDLPVRLEDLHNAQAVLRLSQSEIAIRKDIVGVEQQRIQLGSGSISNLIQKQIDWIDARQRGIENQLRYEIAYASWLYSKGFLLKDYGIDINIQ